MKILHVFNQLPFYVASEVESSSLESSSHGTPKSTFKARQNHVPKLNKD